MTVLENLKKLNERIEEITKLFEMTLNDLYVYMFHESFTSLGFEEWKVEYFSKLKKEIETEKANEK